MTGVLITIRDSAGPKLRKFFGNAGAELRRRIARAVGVDEQNLIRNHFLKLQATRHATAERLGAEPTNYWGKAAESVSAPAAMRSDEESATIKIDAPGISRAAHDVDITPGGKQYLTIPIASEAYGNRILQGGESRFPGGFFFRSKKGNLLYGVRDGAGIHPLYLLKASVHQEQDRSLLPSDEEFTTTAAAAIRDELLAELKTTETEIKQLEA